LTSIFLIVGVGIMQSPFVAWDFFFFISLKK
jgi:hypothetical protein